MSKIIIPEGYKSALTAYETQTAIGLMHTTFEKKLEKSLNLKRVSAPLFVAEGSGLNDDLNGIERAVNFDIKETGTYAQVVHSLAKWKRLALMQYGFEVGEGIWTDMNAIRRDEEMDNLHSIYVDQWDWERIITKADRKIGFLKSIVKKIVKAICDTQTILKRSYPSLTTKLERNVTFISTQQLADKYPNLTPKERENAIAKEYKTVCITKIGGVLRSGQKHDGRAPDYDDWTLNCDILFWSDVLNLAVEISSMGIRVDRDALEKQLRKANCEDRKSLPFHRMLIEGKLPLTIGGGIGQSRLSMLLLEKAHVGEVQVSIWDDYTKRRALEAGIDLL